jgi:protein involved in polysaccharide export with SLBB domain
VKKIVYIHPGDMVEIRVVQDPELPLNATEWNYQRHITREFTLIHRVGRDHWEYNQSCTRFEPWKLKNKVGNSC